MRTAAFTIVSKNYLAFARTLLSSVKECHPAWDRYLLLVDENDDSLFVLNNEFTVVELSEINLPDIKKMLFRYTILELNTAVKPWMFYWLFNNKEYDSVVYLDPDIFVYDQLSELEQELSKGSLMVLTPHLTGQLNDEKHPSELDIMRSGIYNLGFLGVSKNPQTNSFLDWWKSKLEYDCVVDLEKGLFVDQKWMDFAPTLFDNVKILRHEGYNVAYWNLNHRKIKYKEGRYSVNGERLVFFHFSGVNPSNPSNFSKHQNRFNIDNIGITKDLLKSYASEVMRNDHENFVKNRYSFNYFSNGILINEFCRRAYRNNNFIIQKCGENPFGHIDIFNNEPLRDHGVFESLPLITYVMYEVWGARSDLRKAFPDVLGKDRLAFCQWYVESVQREYGFDNAFINPVKESILKFELMNGQKRHCDVANNSLEGEVYFKKRQFNISKIVYKFAIRLKPLLKKLISRKTKERLKKIEYELLRQTYSGTLNKMQINSSSVTNIENKTVNYEKGVNVVGYIRAETGIGESSRSSARALSCAEIDFGVINFEIGNVAHLKDVTWQHKEADNFLYNTNLFHINADQMMVAKNFIDEEKWNHRYNIGYWAWELPDFPDEWLDSLKLLNEIWAPSRFVVEAIAEKSPIPVVRIPHNIQIECDEAIKKDYFGLPEGTFLFLSMYDTYSIQARKNPQGAIEAFKKTFKPNDKTVGLVIKINNSKASPEELDYLKESLAEYENIYFIDKGLTRQEVNALINNVDVFVSLHRSEGFGLVLAEAMYLGKPVIGTNWSGNSDFMNKNNSCAVDYKLVKLGQDYGPYKAYQSWAEPDLDNASYYMKKLVTDHDFYNKIAFSGSATIRNEYSPEAVGKLIRKRLQYLDLI